MINNKTTVGHMRSGQNYKLKELLNSATVSHKQYDSVKTFFSFFYHNLNVYLIFYKVIRFIIK